MLLKMVLQKLLIILMRSTYGVLSKMIFQKLLMKYVERRKAEEIVLIRGDEMRR